MHHNSFEQSHQMWKLQPTKGLPDNEKSSEIPSGSHKFHPNSLGCQQHIILRWNCGSHPVIKTAPAIDRSGRSPLLPILALERQLDATG
jgi:hypothetical protein